MAHLILILLVFVVGSAHGLRQRRQANGCGSGYFNIDQDLKLVGESVIIPCCNQHDICYDTCGKTQYQCDNVFRSCLHSACRALNGNGFQWWIDFRQAACEQDGRILYQIVNAVGHYAFNSAQRAHRCRG